MENEVAVKKEFSIELLIEKAIDNKIPVETIERLLVVRKELKEERAKEEFCQAMSNFQFECPIIGKLDTVNIKTKSGSSFSYKYASLDLIVAGVRRHLKNNGFSYTFDTDFNDNCQVVTCTATHIEGYSKTASFRAPIESDAGMSLVQKNGAALTFAKRYAFCLVFGIITGEDNEQQLNDEYERKKPNSQKPQSKSSQAKEPESITPEVINPQEAETVSYYKRLKSYAELNKITIEALDTYLHTECKITKRSEVTEEIYNKITNNIATIEMLIKESIGGK